MISEECFNRGYYGCKEIKDIIDAVLHKNAVARMQLGISSSRDDVEAASRLEDDNLLAVRYLDKDFIDNLLSTENSRLNTK